MQIGWDRTFETLPDLVALIDREHRILRVNKAMAERLGRSPVECIGQHCYRLLHGMDDIPAFCPHLRLLEDGAAHSTEIHEEHLGGDFIVSASPFFDERGALAGCVHVARDITKQKNIEDSVRRREEQLRNIVEHSTNVFFSHTPDHVLTYMSPRVRDVLGYEPEEAMIRWTELSSDNPLNREGFELTQRAIDTGERQTPYRLELVRKDGRKVWVEVNESPIVRDGKTVEVVGSLTDVTGRQQAQNALRESEERFRTIFDSVNDAITIHDLATGAVLYFNERVLELTGYGHEEAHHLNVAALSSGVHPYTPEEALKWLKRAADGKPHLVEWQVRDKEGSPFWVEVNMRRALIQGRDCLIIAARDITDRRGIEDALKENERRLRLITNNMLDLVTVVDVNGGIEFISPSHRQVLGYGPEELIKEWGVDLIHPDDRDMLTQSIRGTIARGKPGVAQFRVRHADGHHVWLETVGNPILDEDGTQVGIIFSSRDITEWKSGEQALRNGEEKYREILDNIDDGYYEVDLAGNFTFFNDVLPRFMGYSRDELMGSTFRTAMDEENAVKVFQIFHEVYRTGIPRRLAQWESTKKDGSKVYVESSVFLVRDADGRPAGFRGVVRDITERKQFQDRLHAMAITDQLTELHNRRGFISLAGQQLKAAVRMKQQLLLAFIDLDGMKRINDIWGHEEGDRALVNAAKVLRQTFRGSDIIARIGGDEFAVLALDVTEKMPEIFMGRLQARLDDHNSGEDRGYLLSLSVGNTFFDPENPRTLDELMSEADKLMYEDKRRKSG